jgi:crotonobetainyl-CoA:carnitine CoA-transferase CaiB-like acyl-CoA transferase
LEETPVSEIDLPLAGIRVLDMADEKGELAGRCLSDLGAEVIRAEPPGGARSRHLPPFAPDGEHSLYFAVRNAGKRGVTLDPSQPTGRELLHRLLDTVDIWIESFEPRRLEEYGLEPTGIAERHPTLIHTSITDFGHTGPYRDYQGTDMIGFAMGGMMHRAGAAHRPPVVAPGSMAYDCVGVTAGFASLLAYLKRMQTGRGQHVDVSVQESVHNLADWSLPNYSLQVQADENAPVGARQGAGIFPLIPCADGHVRVILLSVHHWRALRAWMGEPEEFQADEMDNLIVRLMKREEIEAVIARWMADKKKIDLSVEAQSRNIPITPLLRPSEVIVNEHTVARGTFKTMELWPGVEGQVASGFYEIDGERAGPNERPPLPGEHNADVYGGLGLGVDDLAALRASGAI